MQPFMFTPWSWRDPSMLPGWPGAADVPESEPRPDDDNHRDGNDLTGYKGEALDGGIGSIDEANHDVGSAYLVVDTGPWIFGHKVLLPAGTVQRIDHADRVAYVDRTKDQIKHSPEYDADTFRSNEYRDRVGAYYDDSYRSTP